jgi:signal transduction histidine kinase
METLRITLTREILTGGFIGVKAVERPTVAITIIIVSDEPDFAGAITSRWQGERNSPLFSIVNSDSCGQLQARHFNLAIVGGLRGSSSSVLEVLGRSGKPAIYVSRPNGHSLKLPGNGMVQISETDGWLDTLLVLATQILERERAATDLVRLTETNTQLEREASLGRYMLEMRHSLNNALTSLLGNSELMLLESAPLAAGNRVQLETVRNMGMRINEIMQRFSSLQKEMQLMEQQDTNKRARAAANNS